MRNYLPAMSVCAVWSVVLATAAIADTTKPNVILIMTDDQGWGEVGFHGNKTIKTPNLDRFAAEGTELTHFYVSPMCTPTRSSLMTGRYHFRTGAHDTYIGRSNMNPQETTMAEVFASAGYRTGIFGKWHLGENYPMRAIDQGFQKAVVHGGGGIGQFADYPKNSYWDPALLYNDTFKKAKGYCTDVFIDESIRFIENSRSKPFFCYIPLNIPHSPFDVGKAFREGYDKQNLKDPDGRNWVAPIYGMITQFDGAFQRLLDAVDKMGLKDNTIIIFMTDNGPNSVYYTAGLRAKKGSVYENGIRSPFVIQWPKGMKGGRKLSDPAMHIDLLPTLAEACGIQLPANLKVDGTSILPLLTGAVKELPARYLFMQHNRGNLPTKYKNGMVRNGPWKAVGNRGNREGFELYNIEQDPGEKQDLAAQHPDKVKAFVREYEAWFDDVTAELRREKGMPHPIELNPIQKHDFRFTWQDWWGENTGWRPTDYGRWRVNNPGLIDRFDITILPHRQHHGKAATLKFIWQGKTAEKTFDQLPAHVVLENVELAKGTGFMEAQLQINGKVWGVQEVRIKAHAAATAYSIEEPVTKSPGKAVKHKAGKLKLAPTRSMKIPAVRGQFIRIELPGQNRTLSLAEVEVFESGRNLALKKKATQSTIAFGGTPARAVDGDADGDYHSGSVTHTELNRADPWWEVDLGLMANIEQIVIYNRTDGGWRRLDSFTLKILDAKRKVVFSKDKIPEAAIISFLQPGVKPSRIVKAANERKESNGASDSGTATQGAHLFLLAGQSNMHRLDPDISFTPAVTRAFGAESVIVVKDAHSGQPISRWVKGWVSVKGVPANPSGDLYKRLIAKATDAIAGREIETVTLLWMQGEHDASRNQTGVYTASLDKLLNQLKRDLKRDDIHFVLGRLSDYSLDSGKHPEWQAMRELQVAYADADRLRAWVDTDDLNNVTDSRTGQTRNDVHYTTDGYHIFGQRLADKAIGLIRSRSLPGKKGTFKGFDSYQFRIGRVGVEVICPKKAAPGKPWLWRGMFWKAIARVHEADLTLVEQGYHVVLVSGDISGHPRGNANIDAAYNLLTTEYGFSKKCSMASMSRVTLQLFRWASANPEKVESIYVDNGVCNVKSWPAGKLVRGSGSIASGAPQSWEHMKKAYGFATDEQALAAKISPIDWLEPLAKAGVPILMVCGNKDKAVPYEENDAIMEQRYKALGGPIKVIFENKGHSHGMKDPTPVLHFIKKHTRTSKKQSSTPSSGQEWVIDSQREWQMAAANHSNLEFQGGFASPTAKRATFQSTVMTYDKRRSAKSITIAQSPVWHNWMPIPNIGPSNLGDAPVMLRIGPGNYWMFGRYGSRRKKDFKPEAAQLNGYDVPLQTTPFPNQYDAPGGLKEGLGGYHAWQSKDTINWVHHGPVTEAFSCWVTTAEYVDGKVYIYYDYPNDQDPHLYIDDDLTDGAPGKNMGIAFKDPSHGSDCAVIRDLKGNFHVIYEDWSPIDASKHSWDSPLAGHAVSRDGIANFRILPPAVDDRTKPTGRFAEYPHPHWHATEPKKYPGKPAPVDIPQHAIKAGDIRAFAKYEIHDPVQNAYGDWAAISIGGQHYLFSDYHPAKGDIRVGWFTSSSIDKPFTFCGEIGRGHPDPDVMFAEGKFYLATQQRTDFVSPGPWVEDVEVRVGVDTDNDRKVDKWTAWTTVKERYDYVKGYSKQVAKTPAKLELSKLPEGYGFQFEVKLTDTTENPSQPILDKVTLSFKE